MLTYSEGRGGCGTRRGTEPPELQPQGLALQMRIALGVAFARERLEQILRGKIVAAVGEFEGSF
jgi:hypothetical protein